MVIFALKSSRMYKKNLKDLEGSWMFYMYLEGYFVKVTIGMKILFSERACFKTAKKKQVYWTRLANLKNFFIGSESQFF